MPHSTKSQFLQTVGMEFEGVGLSRNDVSEALGQKLRETFGTNDLEDVCAITRDASTEYVANVIALNGSKHIRLSTHTREASRVGKAVERVTMGYELVSMPLEIDDMAKFVHAVAFGLKGAGDYASERAATHIHVGYAHNLNMMKRLLKVCLELDPLLYKLGGMGGTFRGDSNLAAYARPLLASAAVRVNTRGSTPPPSPQRRTTFPSLEATGRMSSVERANELARISAEAARRFEEAERQVRGGNSNIQYAKTINPIAALSAKTTAEFWACFGVFPAETGLPKYHPCRYSGINFYSILQHMTIEFRHFNQSFDPQLIMALVRLLRSTVEMTTRISKENLQRFDILNPNIPLSTSECRAIIFKLVDICREMEIENSPTDNDVQILVDTAAKSTFKALPKTPVRTHLNDFSISNRIVDLGSLEMVQQVLDPSHVDIHTIKYQSIFNTGG